MAEITKEDALHKWIDSKTALYNLRLESPGAYDAVMRLREEYPSLMRLPIGRVIPVMKKAVETLIEDGFCKRKLSPSRLEEIRIEKEAEKKMKTVKQ